MKFLLDIDGISFYTSAAQIKRGIGQSESCNLAAIKILEELMEDRNSESGFLKKTVGCGRTGYFGHNISIYLTSPPSYGTLYLS